MTIPLSSARVEQIRRAAKRLANAESIPLHEAQHRLANEYGYENWSLMHKHSQAVRPPKVAVTAVPIVVGNGDRQYLHGDQHELEPAHFYCKACDAFVGAGHFYKKHDRQETLRRTLDALEHWARPSNEIAHRRPSNPFNVLEVPARQAEEAYQQSRSPFHQWLEKHRNKKSALGDLASDILGDRRFSRDCQDAG